MTFGTPQDPQGGTGNASLPSAVSDPTQTDNIQTPPTGSVDPATITDSGASVAPAGTQTASTGQEPIQTNLTVEDIVNGGWKNLIPAELKDRSEFQRVEKLDDLMQNYINAQQTISKSVRIPDANSSVEEIQAFYSKLGKPQDPNEYDFQYEPESQDYIFNKDSFDFSVFKEIADKGNLTKAQYENLAKAYVDIQNKNYMTAQEILNNNAAQELRSSEATLREIWGDKYTENINNISSKITKLYPQETLDKMAETGLFRDANFLQSHLKLTKMLTGDTVFIEGNVVENIPQTIESLSAKRDALMADNYTKNAAQVQELNKQIVSLKMAQQGSVGKFKG